MTPTPQSPEREDDLARYLRLRDTDDPIEAFNLFIERNVPEELHAHFADNDDNEAEFVRRVITAHLEAAKREAREGYVPKNQFDAEEASHSCTVQQRDEAENWADKLAYAKYTFDQIGEHSSNNNPWANAFELLEAEAELSNPTDKEKK